MLAAEGLFLLYLVTVATVIPWRRLPVRRLLYLAVGVTAATLWLVTGTTGEAGWHHPLGVRHRHPVSLFDYLLMLWGFALMAVDRYSVRDVRAMLAALVATVPVHFLLALGQRYLDWRGLWWAVRIGNQRLLEVDLRIAETLAGRMTAGAGHPNRLAAYSLICSVAAAALLANAWRAGPAPDAHWRHRLHCVALASICMFGLSMLLWSGSRGAWLSAIVVSLPVAWLVGIRWRYVAGTIGAGALAVALAAVELGAVTRMARRVVPAVIWGRLSASPPAGLRVSPPEWRLEVYRCTWDLAGQRPLTGWGIGGWVDACEARLGIVMNHAHNIFLQVAAESGWIAVIALLLSLIWVLGASTRQINLLPEPASRRLYGALVIMAIAVLLTNQTSMVLMQAGRLEIVFAMALAVPYSLVFHREAAA
jgi:O-antigen ligase